uniref:PDZ domain-containing protein n=1 Tax=Alexandrium catenella TaxID=2925 RepID=A0A7S1S8M7_ALECA|mmetsp:Transcript_90938/g.241526  ORF Transcript_90938/g.241526 Transcript_90938/m.241526 type:complete len:159 (+) Transcript_90938:99-575(+)
MGGNCCADSHNREGENVNVRGVGAKSVMVQDGEEMYANTPEDFDDPESLLRTAPKDPLDGRAKPRKVKVGLEYAITISERNGLKLGIDTCSSKFYPALTIIKVKSDGLIGAWNKSHPDCEVKVGDDLVEVNGERADKDKICQLLAKAARLELKLQRNE